MTGGRSLLRRTAGPASVHHGSPPASDPAQLGAQPQGLGTCLDGGQRLHGLGSRHHLLLLGARLAIAARSTTDSTSLKTTHLLQYLHICNGGHWCGKFLITKVGEDGLLVY